MGRLTFETLLRQERRALQGKSLRLPINSDPLRPLARKIATARHAERQAHGLHGGGQTVSSPVGSVRASSVETVLVSDSPPPSPSPRALERRADLQRRIRDQVTREINGDDETTGMRYDASGNLMVRVVTADSVRRTNSDSSHRTLFRHAVIQPTVPGFLKEGDVVLLVGMVHLLVRTVKNHGSGPEQPSCRVIECHGDTFIVLLLVANQLIHPSFQITEHPHPGFVGTESGSSITAEGYLEDVGNVSGISASHYRSLNGAEATSLL
ncbi:hypothetical protein B0H11DRAFT_1910202 [Mycena galericulata]|nr:hypothetical protein B0H11DRAFT_1910202 [Mycena galericulata]